MKFGLMVFPSLDDTRYDERRQLQFRQCLEPSVLYCVPSTGESVFIWDNVERTDVDMYLCSVYSRGWNEFRRFASKIGRDRIIAGGYHPTAMPEEVLKFARKVVVGYCGNIDSVLDGPDGIVRGAMSFTPMRRDLIQQSRLSQVHPDRMSHYIVGSMVTSVGCPFDCIFCSTPIMSGRRSSISTLDYVDSEIADMRSRRVDTVFVRDESFATNPLIGQVSERFKNKFKMVYSFATGNVMGSRELIVKKLADVGWHSLLFGLENVGVSYKKNRLLKQACEYCHKYGIGIILSFIVDDSVDIEQAEANYCALFSAFCDLRPAMVCANFLMPLPGTGLWKQYSNRITEEDYDKFDSKTPILSSPELYLWHKRKMIALQAAYYLSNLYRTRVRRYDCSDTLNLRFDDLMKQYDITEKDIAAISGRKIVAA